VNSGFSGPSNLVVTAGNEKLTLSWTSGTTPFARGIWVQYKTSAASAWTWSSSTGATSPYDITGLTNDTAYNVRIFGVACCNSGGHNIRGIFVTGSGTPTDGTTPSTTDATLSGLTASTSTSSTGTFTALTLTPSTFAATTTSYTASVANSVTHAKLTPTVNDSSATVKVGKGTSLTTVTSGSASAAIALAAGANAITVQVTAADGTTTKTYTVTVTRAAASDTTTVPAAPTGLLAEADVSGALVLSWTAPAGTLTGYDVHYTSAAATGSNSVSNSAAASGSNPATAWVASARGTETSPPAVRHKITGLTNETTYRIRVRAKNSAGSSGWVFTTGTPEVSTPLEPVNVTVKADHASLRLSWNRNPDTGDPPTSYIVHYTASATVDEDAAAGTNAATQWVDTGYSGAATSYTITGLTNGTTYRMRVRAKNSAGVSQLWSLEATGTPVARTVSLSASPNPVTEGASVTVTVRLSRAHSSALVIPVTVATASPNTAESGDVGTLTSITVNAGSTTGTGTIATNQDTGKNDETFTVSLGTLPSSVSAGSPSSVTVTIKDDDNKVLVSLSPTAVRVDEGRRVSLSLVLSRRPKETHGKIPLVSEGRCTDSPNRYHELVTGIRFQWVDNGSYLGITNIQTGNVPGDTVCTIRVDGARLPADYAVGSGGTVTVTIVDIPDQGGGSDGDDSGEDPGGPPPPPPGGPPPPPPGGPPPPPPGGPPPPPPGDPPPPPPPGGPPRAAIETDASCEAGLCRARTGAAVSFRDASTGAVSSRLWDFDDGGRSRGAGPSRSWASPGFYEVTLTVSDGTVESTASLTFLVEAAEPAGTCVADEETRCLRDSRFAVEMDWWTGEDQSGPGKVVPEGTNGSGLFHFFEPRDNWEVLVKVLDGCSVNGHVWVYGASATTLGYTIRVTDTVTAVVREYMNEDGRRADAIADDKAFAGTCGDDGPVATAAAAAAPAATAATAATAGGAALPDPPPPVDVEAAPGEGVCTDSATTMCLLGGRYEVTASWSSPPAAGGEPGETGPGRVARARTPGSGLFYFFDPENWEMLVKVLDACADYGHHWVFAASATDLGLDLVVRDTVTGEVRNYVRDPGEPSPAVADVSAFPNACRSD
jgi:PKD repeat protein